MKVVCLGVSYNRYQGYSNNPANGNLPGEPIDLVNATVSFGPANAATEANPLPLQAQNFSLTFERIDKNVEFFPGKTYTLELKPVKD